MFQAVAVDFPDGAAVQDHVADVEPLAAFVADVVMRFSGRDVSGRCGNFVTIAHGSSVCCVLLFFVVCCCVLLFFVVFCCFLLFGA